MENPADKCRVIIDAALAEVRKEADKTAEGIQTKELEILAAHRAHFQLLEEPITPSSLGILKAIKEACPEHRDYIEEEENSILSRFKVKQDHHKPLKNNYWVHYNYNEPKTSSSVATLLPSNATVKLATPKKPLATPKNPQATPLHTKKRANTGLVEQPNLHGAGRGPAIKRAKTETRAQSEVNHPKPSRPREREQGEPVRPDQLMDRARVDKLVSKISCIPAAKHLPGGGRLIKACRARDTVKFPEGQRCASRRCLPPRTMASEEDKNGIFSLAANVDGLVYIVRCLVPITERSFCATTFKPTELAAFLDHLDKNHNGGGVQRPSDVSGLLMEHGLLLTKNDNGSVVPLDENTFSIMKKSRAGSVAMAAASTQDMVSHINQADSISIPEPVFNTEHLVISRGEEASSEEDADDHKDADFENELA